MVIGILALLYSVAAPRLSGGRERLELKTFAMKVAGELRSARARAIKGYRQEAVALDAKQSALISAPGGRRLAFSEGIEIKIAAARLRSRSGDSAGIVFFADGSSSGGRITISSGAERTTIAVEWLSGVVEIGP